MKKWISIVLCLIMVIAILAIPTLASGETFVYEIIYTDVNGNEITDLSSLNVGDTLNVKLMLYRTDDDESYQAYGIEMSLMSKGLSYNSDGKSFNDEMNVGFTTQKVNGTQTVRFAYYDTDQKGMSVPAAQQIGTCSYKVTSKDASVSLAVGLVYLVGVDDAYTITPNKCVHANRKTTYTSNNNGTHVADIVCKDCGKTLETYTGDCNYTSEITKEPTCEEKGEKTYTCERCEYSYTEELAAKGHTEVTDPAVDATCTEDGKTEGSHCSVCGKVLKEQETVKATGHDYDEGKVTKEPTCEEKGEKTYTCERCGYSYTEELAAKGHTVVTDPAVDATCTEDGKTEGSHCSVCGKVLKEQETVKATGHKWDEGKVTKKPTTTEEGIRTYTCTVCSFTRTEPIPKLEEPDECIHENTEIKYASNNNGTHAANTVCKDCGETLETHTDDCDYTSEITKEPTCEEKGEETYTCKYCEYSYTEELAAKGHTEVTDPAVDATCTEDGKTEGSHCSVCGKVLKEQETVKATGHDWDEGTVTKEPTTTEEGIKTYTCTICGTTRTEAIEKLPVDPEEPENPEEPEKPDDTKKDDTKKDDTSKKDDQSKTDKKTDDTSKTQPSTGDTGMTAIYAVAASIAVIGFGFITIMKKKRA